MWFHGDFFELLQDVLENPYELLLLTNRYFEIYRPLSCSELFYIEGVLY